MIKETDVHGVLSCEDLLNFISPPQCKYMYFHISKKSSFTWMFIWTQFIDQLPVGLLAQLVERCTGIVEVMGSNPVRAWNFFQVLYTTTRFSSVLSCEDLLNFILKTCLWLNVSCNFVFVIRRKLIIIKHRYELQFLKIDPVVLLQEWEYIDCVIITHALR